MTDVVKKGPNLIPAGSFTKDPVTGELTEREPATKPHPEGNRARPDPNATGHEPADQAEKE